MITHLESVGKGGFVCREIIDAWDIFECSKGHKWKETLENRFRDLPLPITLPIPNGENICPFCLSELLSNLGRVTKRTIKEVTG